jgi:hypothetical protein
VNEDKSIEQLVHRIISGKQIIKYEDSLYELRTPSLDLKLEADLVYNEVYEDNLYKDFILIEDLKHYLINFKIISSLHTEIVKDNELRLENAKVKLFSEYLDSKKIRNNKNSISSIRHTLSKLNNDFHSISFLVLENFAENAKYEFLIKNTLYNYKSDNLAFKDSDIDSILFNNIVQEIAKNSIDMTTYKTIARSEYWRNMYVNSKHNLFPYPSIYYSEEQKALLNISSMYDKIYEHPECPDDNIISDDDALDGWMIVQKRQNLKQKKEKGVDNMVSEKIKNSKEVFFISGNDKEQTKEILELNSSAGLQKIKTRADAVQNNQSVQEHELTDVRQELRARLQELNRKK